MAGEGGRHGKSGRTRRALTCACSVQLGSPAICMRVAVCLHMQTNGSLYLLLLLLSLLLCTVFSGWGVCAPGPISIFRYPKSHDRVWERVPSWRACNANSILPYSACPTLCGSLAHENPCPVGYRLIGFCTVNALQNNNNNKRPLTPKSMPPAGDEHAKLKT